MLFSPHWLSICHRFQDYRGFVSACRISVSIFCLTGTSTSPSRTLTAKAAAVCVSCRGKPSSAPCACLR
jgi:hypothetical protein